MTFNAAVTTCAIFRATPCKKAIITCIPAEINCGKFAATVLRNVVNTFIAAGTTFGICCAIPCNSATIICAPLAKNVGNCDVIETMIEFSMLKKAAII